MIFIAFQHIICNSSNTYYIIHVPIIIVNSKYTINNIKTSIFSVTQITVEVPHERL